MEYKFIYQFKPTHAIEEYIAADDCENGYIYQIRARNGNFGVCWDGNFYLSRWKWKQNFIFPEVHWDLDDRYGTAKPLVKLNKCEEFKSKDDYDHDKLLEILNKIEDDFKNKFHIHRTENAE